MRAPSSSFARWRRSTAGAWLAMLYALAMLATALASPVQAGFAPGGEPVTLCSGQILEPETGQLPDDPAGHCKGCPAMPAAGLPPSPGYALVPVMVAASVRPPASGCEIRDRFPLGLARPRAPPAA